MKGIVLAGGSGTRLYPLTKVTSKQLLPVYDKPMIYYPLSVLMEAQIKDILIISDRDNLPRFMELLGDGSSFGINLTYKLQEKPEGLAQAFTIAEDFVLDDDVAMILGDNIFYGDGLKDELLKAKENAKNNIATVFGYHVFDPERFGVVEFKDGKVISIEEKPDKPKSNYAVTGLYFYDNSVIKKAKTLKKSKRGEYEITDLNRLFLEDNKLSVITLGKGYAWFDTGTFNSLLKASMFVQILEENQNITIASIEEIAYNNGWLSKEKVKELAIPMKKNSYGKHLLNIVEEK